MRSFAKWILRLILIVITGLSLILLLNSEISIKTNNTPGLAKSMIEMSAGNTEESRAALKIAGESGALDAMLNGLPRKTQLQFSYLDIYQLAGKYQEQGRLSASDLGLTSSSEIENAASQYLVQGINRQLDEDPAFVRTACTIYRFAIWIIVLLYLLAAVLLLFGRGGVTLPLLLGDLASFGGLLFLRHQMQSTLRAQVYSGISVSLISAAWLGFILGIVVALVWPFVKNWGRRKRAS